VEIDNAGSPDRERLWRYWLQLTEHYAALGFRGFRCDAAYKVPGELWQYLIERIAAFEGPRESLARSLASERIHSAYLLTGPGEAPRAAAAWFARAIACTGAPVARPCEACPACRRSTLREAVPLDGTGKSGPLYRHVGDHPDLLWVERGRDDTRVRIAQIRAVQHALYLRPVEGGRRAVVIADAEWLNLEAQNALLRVLEEPPPGTTFLLVTASPSGLAPTVRSRCQKVAFPAERPPAPDSPEAPETVRALAERLAGLSGQSILALLDWAEEYRGVRAVAAAGVQSKDAAAPRSWSVANGSSHSQMGASTAEMIGIATQP
jgi:DNA polymerase III delta prime subunit